MYIGNGAMDPLNCKIYQGGKCCKLGMRPGTHWVVNFIRGGGGGWIKLSIGNFLKIICFFF